ncbi:MAG: hypothetical protein AAB305_01660 [Candidatus Zixiibacteriota bacterium]
MNLRDAKAILVIPAVLFLSACASRYRLDLNMTLDGLQSRVKVESSEFASRCGLGDPYSDTKTIAGTTSCLVVTLKGRGKEVVQSKDNIVRFDETMTCRLFIELPAVEKGFTVNLVDNSFVHRLGRYDIPAEEKIYLPSLGTLTMDSLRGEFLYATVHGGFSTRGGKTLGVDGEFRVRVDR